MRMVVLIVTDRDKGEQEVSVLVDKRGQEVSVVRGGGIEGQEGRQESVGGA
jgi:hypothetical protein